MADKQGPSRKQSRIAAPARAKESASPKLPTWDITVLDSKEGLAALAKRLGLSSTPQTDSRAAALQAFDPGSAAPLSPPRKTPSVPPRFEVPVTPTSAAPTTVEAKPPRSSTVAPPAAPKNAAPAPVRSQITEAALASIAAVRQRIHPEVGHGGFSALIPAGVLGALAIVSLGGALAVARIAMLRAENPFGVVNPYQATAPRPVPNPLLFPYQRR